jgi:hypothetical protein
MGSTVPPDGVRIEEMLNYFNFELCKSTEGQHLQGGVISKFLPLVQGNQLLFLQSI